jgi:hypothetical protein
MSSETGQMTAQAENPGKGLSLVRAILYGLALSVILMIVESFNLGYLRVRDPLGLVGAMGWAPLLFVTVAAIANLLFGVRRIQSFLALLVTFSIFCVLFAALLGRI